MVGKDSIGQEGMEGEPTSETDGQFPSTTSIPIAFDIGKRITASMSTEPTPQRRMFGNVLRKIRKIRGLSIYELAKKAEVDAGYISRLENAHRNPPSPRVLQQFARALDFSIDLLMIAAGYLEFDNQGNKLTEEEIIRQIEFKLTGKSPQAFEEIETSEDEFSVLPMLESGDIVLAVNEDGEQIQGRIYLSVATEKLLIPVTAVTAKIGPLPK